MRFEVAVTRSLREHATGFFPTLGEFLAFVPGPGGERKTCNLCRGALNGMIYGWSVHPESGARYKALRACKHEMETEEEIA